MAQGIKRALIAGIICISFTSFSCGTLQKVPTNPIVSQVIDCGKAGVLSLVDSIISRVNSILAIGATNFENQLEDLIKDSSEEALACAVNQAKIDFTTNVAASPSASNAARGAKNADKFIADKGYKFKQ